MCGLGIWGCEKGLACQIFRSRKNIARVPRYMVRVILTISKFMIHNSIVQGFPTFSRGVSLCVQASISVESEPVMKEFMCNLRHQGIFINTVGTV